MVEHLPSMHQALGLISSTTKSTEALKGKSHDICVLFTLQWFRINICVHVSPKVKTNRTTP
jgi:hypothetical protein